MQRKVKLRIAKTVIILAAVPVLIKAFEYGPDAGYVGVPGENASCISFGCHTGTANADGGKVEVTFPDGLSYTPGAKQHLIVTITDATARRWGFELTARPSDPKTMAGTFTPSDGRTQVLCASTNLFSQNPGNPGCPANLPLQYIEHTLAGYNTVQANPGKYEFDWTPPATNVGNVTIYVAGNAANGDLKETGDHIYTNKYTLTPSAGGGSKPTISEVVNGAGFQANIQQGSWVTIKGSNLASTSRLWATADFVGGKVPTKLDGVSVSINGKAAAVEFVDPQQINVWSPLDSSVGPVNVTVSNSNGTSDAFMVRLQAFSPAVFLWPGSHAVTTQGGTYIGPPGLFGAAITTVPAKPGDVVTLWGTGFGPTNPDPPADQAVPVSPLPNMTTTPTIRVGGITAQYLGGALSPGAVGLYQINVRLPANLPDGDLKLEIDIGGVQSPDGVFLNVKK
jgi:uncharacterized protein (TIGR03437 family)